MRWVFWVILAVLLSGCDGGMMEGILIGAGTSTVATEGQALAEQKKSALVAEIVKLRSALEIAQEDPAEKAVLEAKLVELEKKQSQVEMTDLVSSLVKETIQRDWGSKPMEGQDGRNNLAYILGTAATAAAAFAGKKTLEANQKDKAISRVKIAAKAQNDGEKEAEIYRLIGDA